MITPADRFEQQDDGLCGWTGIAFERFAEWREGSDWVLTDDGCQVLNRVLECQKRDLLDGAAKDG